METPPTTPSLYLFCWDNTEWLETTYALIELTPAWAQRMCGLVHQMAALRQASHTGHGPTLYQMEYWDDSPTWLTRPNSAGDDGEILDALCDDIENAEGLYLAAGHTPWTPTDADRQSVECVTLRVQEDGISWAAHVKHADSGRLWTADIPLRDLERYARGQEPVSATVITYEHLAEEGA